MKKTLFITMTLLCQLCFAQKPKIHSYYDQVWNRVEDPKDARFYRVVDKKNGKYFVKDYYMSGALQSEITCTAISPKLQFDAKLTLFHENGKPAQVGRFKDEKPYGYHEYFDVNGTIRKAVTIRDGKMYFHQAWDENGNELLTNGSGRIEELNLLYGPINTLVIDSLIVASYYKVNQDTIYNMVEKQPEYRGGFAAMTRDLRANLKYPRISRKNGSEGIVYVRFIVTGTGAVKDCAVIKSVDPAVDAEALQAVAKLDKWEPGSFAGKNVNVAFVLPVRFNLRGWF